MKSIKFSLRFAVLAPAILGLAGCLNIFGGTVDSVPPSMRQLPASTQALLAVKGMTEQSPIFVRIFKEESEFEVWKLKDGRFQLFKTYPICAWSGAIGPKVVQGDRQAPEGFYTVSKGQMNPNSLYHLAFNIGFPNTYDRVNGHSGSALMVHGDCRSAGCYAMTDAYIEEIYILAREAFAGGQTYFHVHAYPFRMTAENMQRHRDSPWYPFWTRLKEGYDAFEASGKPPIIKVCSKEYLVNVRFPGHPGDPSPEAACPLYSKIDPNQMPGLDGVPQTMLASLSKQQSTQPAEQPPVETAVLQPAHKTEPTISSGVTPAMSASPVVTRSAGMRPASVIASMQPIRSLAPQVLSPKVPAMIQPAPVRVSATVPFTPPASSPVSPVSSASQPVSEEVPTKYVDPDALQKPNRSGKGGKLPAPQAPQSSDSGSMSSSSSASASYGFAGTMR